MAARRFLYIFAALIAIVLLAGLGWSLFQDQLMRATFVPTVRFTAPPPSDGPDYADPANWLSRPDLPRDPARWLPPGTTPAAPAPEAAIPVFYVLPTSSLDRSRWNAPIGDNDALARARLFASSQASVFTGVGTVWAPLYRQATVGAFLTTRGDARLALDLAYRDVARAFDAFLAAIPADRPFILAGHSQGALHLVRLMAERVAGTPLAARVVAAYPIGWPISVTADLPRLGLPACTAPEQPGCIVSYQSFAEPADPRQIRALYDATRGLDGTPRRGTAMLCTNPILGTRGPDPAPAAANRGTLVPALTLTTATLEPGRVPARCDAQGLLLIGGAAPKGFGRFILPGNNYHVFDYALFWADLRSDVARRAAAFQRR